MGEVKVLIDEEKLHNRINEIAKQIDLFCNRNDIN